MKKRKDRSPNKIPTPESTKCTMKITLLVVLIWCLSLPSSASGMLVYFALQIRNFGGHGIVGSWNLYPFKISSFRHQKCLTMLGKVHSAKNLGKAYQLVFFLHLHNFSSARFVCNLFPGEWTLCVTSLHELGGASSFPIRYAPPQLVQSLFILKHWCLLLECWRNYLNAIARATRVTHWYKYFRCYQKHKSFRLTQFWYPISGQCEMLNWLTPW
jgi:hypothetical protein